MSTAYAKLEKVDFLSLHTPSLEKVCGAGEGREDWGEEENECSAKLFATILS